MTTTKIGVIRRDPRVTYYNCSHYDEELGQWFHDEEEAGETKILRKRHRDNRLKISAPLRDSETSESVGVEELKESKIPISISKALNELTFESQNNLTSQSYKSLKKMEYDETQSKDESQDKKSARVAEAKKILIDQIMDASICELKELAAIRTMQCFHPEWFEVKALVKRFMKD